MKYKILLSLILVLHLIFVVISMNQPFHGDEIIWTEAANSIMKTGKPVFDYGRNNPMHMALLHVPTNMYILSVFIYFLGYNEISARLVCTIFNILTIFLIYFISLEIFKNNKNKRSYSILAVFLYALNPFTIQSMMLVDVDPGLLNFSLALFLYLYIKEKKYYFLIPSLILVFLSKEVGLVLLFPVLILSNIIPPNKKKILETFVLFIISILIFLLICLIFSKITGLDIFMPLKTNFLGQKANFFDKGEILIHIWNFKNFFYYATPYLISLFFIFSIVFYYKVIKNINIIKRKDVHEIFLINLFVFAIIGLYMIKGGSAWGFPKYYILAMPWISIFIAFMLSKSNIIEYMKKKLYTHRFLFILLIIFMFIYFYSYIGDPLMPEIDTSVNNTGVFLAITLILKSFILYAIIPFAVIYLFFYFSRFNGKMYMALLLLIFFSYAYIDILHTTVDYSTYSKYGDRGIPEVINYVKEKDLPIEKIATHMHIGHYLGLSRYYEITFSYDYPDRFKKEIIDNPEIEYLIIWNRDVIRIGDNMKYFKLEKQIGSYYIYRKII